MPGVFYHPSYNISLFGVEKLHSFDSSKYAKVFAALCDKIRAVSTLAH